MTFIPIEKNQKTAFSELLTAEITPVVQLQFPYNINPELVIARTVSGTVSQSNGQAIVGTGASANSLANIISRIPAKYEPGQGALLRFTAIYTSGVVGSTQWTGVGDIGDGLFFGYEGDTFGVMRRRGGGPEVRTLTVEAFSTDDEDITITLDGEAKNDVTVTSSSNATVTANDIAAEDYSQVGLGWDVEAVGDTVIFFSYDGQPRSGTFTLSGASTASGSFARTLEGVVPTEIFMSQSSWNRDVADGTSVLASHDPTQGQVYQIRYQWLGQGSLEYHIENPATGRFVLVHQEEFAGTSTIPSILNPTLPLCVVAKNTTNTSDIVIKTSSMLGATEGRREQIGVRSGGDGTVSGVDGTEVPILSARNKTVYQGRVNREKVKIIAISAANDHNKPVQVNFYNNPILVDASYTDIDLLTSVMEIDSSASSFVSGSLLFSFVVGSDASETTLLNDPNQAILTPGNHFTATAKTLSGTGAVVTVIFNWVELV